MIAMYVKVHTLNSTEATAICLASKDNSTEQDVQAIPFNHRWIHQIVRPTTHHPTRNRPT